MMRHPHPILSILCAIVCCSWSLGQQLESVSSSQSNKPSIAEQASKFPSGSTVNGFRGIWFTLGQFSKHGDKYSGGLGTYTSSHNPLAVYSPKADKTFFTYGGTPSADQRRLLIMVSYYDHKTGEVAKPVVVHDKVPVNDPHDNGSLQVDADGHIWIFVSGRARSRPGFKYRSTAPGSIEQFELVQESEMTYPQPWYVKDHGWLNLFTKYTKGRELYWETSTDGKHWSEAKKLAGMGGHYQVSGIHGSKIGTFFNYHPGGSVDKRTNVYYVETEDMGTTWTNIHGKPLALPLSAIDSESLVVDYAAQGLNQYACDLNFDSSGRPILLYVTSKGHEPGPENDPRSFMVTAWTGTEWQTTKVCSTDHNYDMGSLWVEADGWKVIVPSKPGPQSYGGGGEVQIFTSHDRGQTWKELIDVTASSPRNHNYVRRPLHAKDPFYAFWADGNPNEFSPSELYFCDSTGTDVKKLPSSMKDPLEEPTRFTPVGR